MLRSGLIFLSIVAIVLVLSGCKHRDFPTPPEYRECGVAVKPNGDPVIYCEWMNSEEPPEYWSFSLTLASRFLLIPLNDDVKRIRAYEAEVSEWIKRKCK